MKFAVHEGQVQKSLEPKGPFTREIFLYLQRLPRKEALSLSSPNSPEDVWRGVAYPALDNFSVI